MSGLSTQLQYFTPAVPRGGPHFVGALQSEFEAHPARHCAPSQTDELGQSEFDLQLAVK
jgi:hypothetical protein